MHITCLIDNLGSGGAQRQLGAVAVALARLGHEVDFVAYHDGGFYRSQFEQAGITVRVVESGNPLRRILMVRSALRAAATDVVLAYLPQPCLYAELAALPSRRWGLVVSERNAEPGAGRNRFPWRQAMHRVADAVVTNSHCNRLMIEACAPFMRGRVTTIYNLLDLDRFTPGASRRSDDGSVVFSAVGTYALRKNPVRLMTAWGMAAKRLPGKRPLLRWRGGQSDIEPGRTIKAQMVAAAAEAGVTDMVDLGGECKDVVDLYRSSDAVILPSIHEGLPNVVCEASACGVPVLTSNVSDAGNLVLDGRSGYLFYPMSCESIADAVVRFAGLGSDERAAMGVEARRNSERLHDADQILQAYEAVLESAAARRLPSVGHWVSDVPESAVQTALAEAP